MAHTLLIVLDGRHCFRCCDGSVQGTSLELGNRKMNWPYDDKDGIATESNFDAERDESHLSNSVCGVSGVGAGVTTCIGAIIGLAGHVGIGGGLSEGLCDGLGPGAGGCKGDSNASTCVC